MFKVIGNAITLMVALALVQNQPLQAQPMQDTLRLTLDQALQIALNDNPTIIIADQEIIKQKYARKGTYSDLFPQIDFSGAYQRTVQKQTMYMDGVEGMDGGLKVGRDNLYSAGFTASMPIISTPLWHSLKLSAYNVELSIEKARSSRIELVDQVKQAFYTVLLAHDALDVYRQAYDNAVFNYNEIERKYQQ